MTSPKAKGIGLLSGGLDSILAVKVLLEQDLELTGILFHTPFFTPRPWWHSDLLPGVAIRIVDLSAQHLEMLKNPQYGFGSQLNPCIDCHALMLREAGKIMEEEGADFLFTGEVLGQRPMSQRRDALRAVEKLAGLPGRVLRPLSAKLLPPTLVETEGRVDRARLLDIQGRSRKRQMKLAQLYGIGSYPQPGGGCMLTKEGFARKLRELLDHYPRVGVREVELLKWGRHFRLPSGSICTIGRHQQDNEALERLAAPADVVLKALQVPGPLGLIIGGRSPRDDIGTAAALVLAYSDAAVGQEGKVECQADQESLVVTGVKQHRSTFEAFMI
jgi:tRNA U34 2-thiouridine synthase MnmA/TrmU